MAVAVISSGTILATGSLQSIAAQGTAGIYYLVLDTSAMESGDELRIVINMRTLNGGALGAVIDTTINGAQDEPTIITDPIGVAYGIECSIQQTAGTFRNFAFSLEQIGGCAVLNEASLLMDGTEQTLFSFEDNEDSWIVIDSDDIGSTDNFTLRCYRKVRFADTEQIVWSQQFPISGSNTRHLHSVVLGFPFGAKYTMQQVASGDPTTVLGTHATSSVNAVGSLTYSHTVTAGTNLLVVTSETRNAPATGITWGGVALTKAVASLGSDVEASVWYLINPAAGTNDVVVSTTGTTAGIVSGATNLEGVDTITPVRSTAVGNGATSVSNNVSTVVGDLVIDAVAGPDNGSGDTPTIDASQTSLHQTLVGATRGLSSRKFATTTSTNMAWTTLRSENWRHAVVAFRSTQAAYKTIDYSVRATT